VEVRSVLEQVHTGDINAVYPRHPPYTLASTLNPEWVQGLGLLGPLGTHSGFSVEGVRAIRKMVLIAGSSNSRVEGYSGHEDSGFVSSGRVGWRCGACWSRLITATSTLLGHLAHKKQPPPRTLRSDYVWGLMVALGRGGGSYERGTPVCTPATLNTGGFRGSELECAGAGAHR